MEEHSPDIRYIKGPENKVADTVSRLPTINDPRTPYAVPSLEKMVIPYQYRLN
jgi:hypothetical protein